MKFLLIYWLIAFGGSEVVTGSATFNDKASCQDALVAIGDAWPGQQAKQPAPGVCVPQGEASTSPAAVVPAPISPSPAAQNSPPAPNKKGP